MQLARLRPQRSFLHKVSGGTRLRSKIKASANRGSVRKVFSPSRKSRTRHGRGLASRRFIPRQPVAPVFKRVAGNKAISESRAVVNSIRSQQREIRAQFSTAARRRFD